MHALALLRRRRRRSTRSSDALVDELDALSVSIEDADAGSDAEQPVFGEPGMPPPGRLAARAHAARCSPTKPRRPRRRPRSLAQRLGARRCSIEAIAPVAEQDWVRLTQAQFGPCAIDAGFWIVPTWHDVPAGARAGDPARPRPGVRHRHPSDDAHVPALDRRARPRRGGAWPRVLDYGCGSGVLAIAAACFGARDDRRGRHRPGRGARRRAPTRSANGVRAARRHARTSRAAATSWSLANILATPLKLLAPLLSPGSSPRRLAGARRHPRAPGRRAAGGLRAVARAARSRDDDDGWILMTGARPARGRAWHDFAMSLATRCTSCGTVVSRRPGPAQGVRRLGPLRPLRRGLQCARRPVRPRPRRAVRLERRSDARAPAEPTPRERRRAHRRVQLRRRAARCRLPARTVAVAGGMRVACDDASTQGRHASRPGDDAGVGTARRAARRPDRRPPVRAAQAPGGRRQAGRRARPARSRRVLRRALRFRPVRRQHARFPMTELVDRSPATDAGDLPLESRVAARASCAAPTATRAGKAARPALALGFGCVLGRGRSRRCRSAHHFRDTVAARWPSLPALPLVAWCQARRLPHRGAAPDRRGPRSTAPR